jgi:hypothetical protein
MRGQSVLDADAWRPRRATKAGRFHGRLSFVPPMTSHVMDRMHPLWESTSIDQTSTTQEKTP